jgi:hypothetical protein
LAKFIASGTKIDRHAALQASELASSLATCICIFQQPPHLTSLLRYIQHIITNMATAPLITFKAGRCTKEGRRITSDPTPGYLYLYSEDELIHLCWRTRNQPATEPEIDLIIVPGDATFSPLVKEPGAEDVRSPTNGRIFVLRFSDSGEKSYFWMQSKSQHNSGDADWFSQRDQRLGQIVDLLLSGEDVDVEREVQEIRQAGNGGDGDADGQSGDAGDLMDLDRQETGGAGQDATGGDPREEGEASREGGADGGRA